MTAVAALMMFAGPALAQSPAGGNVVAGSAAISQAGAATNIHQSTGKAIIDWQGFSVGAQNSVNFYQPGASSVTLNRVVGNEASVINGAINANGQVFIVNSAGVLFGKGSQVNVGGLVASTHDISNSDFMAGRYTFSGTSNAAVINQGRIRAHGGGYVALLGKTVSNDGVISARLGTVAMSAGEKLTLNFEGNSLLDVTIDKGALNALVENKRAIIADGGRVIMTAKAADQVLAAQVNNTGIVQARTIAALKGGSVASGRKGRRTAPKANPAPEADPADVPMAQGNIKIYAYGGIANIAGKLDASASKGGDGGFIETSGDVVNVADGTSVTTLSASGKAGLWLIDPNDFTVAASGGNMTAATLVSNLATTPFEIRTATMGTPGGNGDIFINDAITWSSNTTLTLTAERNVNINQAITAKGDSAGLVLNAGNDININNAVTLEGASATLAMNYGHDYNIRTKASYAGVADEMGPVYDKNGNPVLDANGNQVLGPVAKQDTSGGVYGSVSFTNPANKNGLTINGQDYTLIHSLADLISINSTTPDINGYAEGVGYYALANSLVDAGTRNASVVARLGSPSSYDFVLLPNGDCCDFVVVPGAAATFAGLGHTISNLTVNIPDSQYAGALFGQVNSGSTIRDLGLVNTNITAAYSQDVLSVVAPLVGKLDGIVSHVYASGGSVAGGAFFTSSGLIGWTEGISTPITVSYAFSDISSVTAGLIGRMDGGGSVTNSHATGAASQAGLIGYARGTEVLSSYATGNISGSDTSQNLGGLIGTYSAESGQPNRISNSFATGNVTGGTSLGGLIGAIDGDNRLTLFNVYATGNVTGNRPTLISTSGGVGGLIGSVGNSFSSTDVTIDKAFATGTVTANTQYVDQVGGLIGGLSSNSSTISNSFATGNVNASQSNFVGGLVGSSVGASYSGVFAGGNVIGYGGVGGLLGMGQRGTITDSYQTGNVTRTSTSINDDFVGGLVGQGSQLVITNSYYNSTGVDGSRGNAPYDPLTSDRSTGLGASQIADAKYYANGTINQVLADRAFRADAVRTASTAATGADVASSAAMPSTASAIRAMQKSATLDEVDDGLKQSKQHVRDDDERQAKRRRAAIAAANRAANAPRTPAYRGTIRSIDIDGQRFELERGGSNSGNNGVPASGAGTQ